MTRITPIDWRKLAEIFELDGWVFERERGDHRVYVKAGVARPLVIPRYAEIGLDIIQSNMRTANMSRQRYLELLGRC